MSAVPEEFMRDPGPKRDRPADETQESSHSAWQWIAVVVLLLCWIAEATMCAERGF
jgi:hypothetical protein